MIQATNHLPREALRFIERFDVEVETAFFRYHEDARLWDDWVPAFWYSEKQTKGFITIALGNLCNGVVIQEPPVSRKESDSMGYVDYYCTFGRHAFFIECKQVWVGNNQKSRISTVDMLKIHERARLQINKIKPSQFVAWDVSYGLAMTIGTLWSNVTNRPEIEIDDSRLDEATKQIINNKHVNAVSYMKTPGNQASNVVESSVTGSKRESYPGVFIVWSVKDAN
jgi:hypothetical protein